MKSKLGKAERETMQSLRLKISGLEKVNIELSMRLKQANQELGHLAINYDEKEKSKKSKLGKDELVLAYQMKANGVSTKLAANTFGVTPAYLRARIHRCEINGLGWLQ